MSNCPVDRARFAIVCDSSCDLPLSQLERVGVSFVPLGVATPAGEKRDCLDLDPVDFFVEMTLNHEQGSMCSPKEADYLGTFRQLIDEGYRAIAVVCASSKLTGSCAQAKAAASRLDGARICVVDTLCTSAQMAFVLAALVRDRDAGMDLDVAVDRAAEVARSSRLMIVPAQGSPASGSAAPGRRTGILARVDSLRARAMGMLRLFEIDGEGCVRELLRSRDMTHLAGVMARRVSTYAREVGPITFAEVNAGVPGILATIEKPLHTNEFESDRAAIVNTNPSTTTMLGVGAVGLAYVPASLLSTDDAAKTMKSFGAAR